jgi:uncharacterized membrane protein YbaN (DUF454 family)
MYAKAKQFTLTRPRIKKTVGWVFVVFGFIALIAPILPGAPLVFIGLELLGFKFLFIDKLLRRQTTRTSE